jgi:hypothetical protein
MQADSELQAVRAGGPTAAERCRPAWESLVVFVLASGFLIGFGNRVGFEGDDLNSVLPILHLREALAGDLEIYRPDWQPLSYRLGAVAYALTGSVDAIFTMAQLAVALGIALLYRATRSAGLPALLFIPLLMLFPEILYTGLYYNSSALGFPLVCLAVLLALEGADRAAAAVTGVALAAAVLIRIDFVLIVPAIVVLRLWLRRGPIDLLVVCAAGLAVLAVALATGLLDPRGVVETYAAARGEIIARSDDPGWDDLTKLFVATVALSPLGWAFLAIAMVWTVLHPRAWAPALVGFLCLAPMLFAARNMLTPKYLIPAFSLLPVIVAMVWVAATERISPRGRRRLAALWCAGTAFYLVASVEPDNEMPFLSVATQDGRKIGTHDGHRSWGAYLWHMRDVRETSRASERRLLVEDMLAALSELRTTPVALVGDQSVFSPGGIAWRNLQLALARAGHNGDVIAPGALEFDLPSGRLLMLTPEAWRGAASEGACIVDITDAESRARAAASIAACSRRCGSRS